MSEVSCNVFLLLVPAAVRAMDSYHGNASLSTYLQVVFCSLASNQLAGTVPYMPKLVVANMSFNHFTLPRFEAVPATLELLYLANNNLTGNISQLGVPEYGLKLLDLSYNNLRGPLPQAMPHGLSILNISNNAFVSTLPSNWSSLQNMTELRLDNNQLTGKLPPEWSAWGSNTGNSIQLSITNASLHSRMPRQWIEQFCLAIVRNSSARLLFQPVVVGEDLLVPLTVGPLIELPAQHASINVTLANKIYSFDYESPDSVCGIAYAARNIALLWGIFAALLLATVMCICLWQKCKPKPGPQGIWFSRWRISTVLRHHKLSFSRQVADRGWFLVSDVGWTIYSQVTDAITIHQVFSSGHSVYAYILLAILLVPFATMFILVVRVSVPTCREKVGCSTVMHRVAGHLVGLLLAPILFLGLELAMTFHGIGVPLPAWYGRLGVDLVTFYRTQSVAETFLSALPQSIVQSKLYLMGNDPNGIHVYIDTNLFLISMIGSLFSILKTVALIAIELHQYGCSLLAYGLKLIQFQTFDQYRIQV